MESSRNKQLVSFTLLPILNTVMKSHIALLSHTHMTLFVPHNHGILHYPLVHYLGTISTNID